MAVNSLSLLTSLRPWRAAGVSHLLAFDSTEEAAQAASFCATELLPPGPGPGLDPPRPFSLPQPPKNIPPHRSSSQSDSSGRTARTPADFLRNTRNQDEARAAVRPDLDADNLRSGSEYCHDYQLPEQTAWPEAWRKLFAKTRPAPVLWTYAELANDLTSPSDESLFRSSLLKNLIKDLKLPRGTSVFWPPLLGDFADEEQLSSAGMTFTASRYFFAALSELKPLVVIFFCSAGQDNHTPYFSQHIIQGRAFVSLPPLESLGRDLASLRRTSVFLRSILASLPL